MPPIRAPTIGMIRSATSDATILPNAVPMMTPTARSTTLPFSAKSRNSRSMLMGCSRIVHLEDFELLLACRRVQPHDVAFARLDERARGRRDPRHVALRRVGLVDAADGDGPLT